MAYTLRQLIDMIRTVPDARTALQKLNDKVEGLGGGNNGGGGDPSIASTDSLPEGSINLYFSPQRVRNTSLTGLVTTDNSDVTANDTVLSGIGKLQAKSDGYGDVVTYNIGTSGVKVPVLNGVNTWSEKQTFSGGIDVELDAAMVQDGNQSQDVINLYGAKSYDMPTGGYPVNAVVRLDSGDIVKSTAANNTVNPNVDMIGWVKTNDASQIVDESGKTQQEINNNQRALFANILDYGAKPFTGSPQSAFNNYASIQAAVNDLDEGGTLYIPAGNWAASTSKIYIDNKNINIKCDGKIYVDSTTASCGFGFRHDPIVKSGSLLTSAPKRGATKLDVIAATLDLPKPVSNYFVNIRSTEILLMVKLTAGDEPYYKIQTLDFVHNDFSLRLPNLYDYVDKSTITLNFFEKKSAVDVELDIVLYNADASTNITNVIQTSGAFGFNWKKYSIKIHENIENINGTGFAAVQSMFMRFGYADCSIFSKGGSGSSYNFLNSMSSFLSFDYIVSGYGSGSKNHWYVARHGRMITFGAHCCIGIDDHYGHDYYINDSILPVGVSFTGGNITFNNVIGPKDSFLLVFRSDAPLAQGRCVFNNCSVDYGFLFVGGGQTSYSEAFRNTFHPFDEIIINGGSCRLSDKNPCIIFNPLDPRYILKPIDKIEINNLRVVVPDGYTNGPYGTFINSVETSVNKIAKKLIFNNVDYEIEGSQTTAANVGNIFLRRFVADEIQFNNCSGVNYVGCRANKLAIRGGGFGTPSNGKFGANETDIQQLDNSSVIIRIQETVFSPLTVFQTATADYATVQKRYYITDCEINSAMMTTSSETSFVRKTTGNYVGEGGTQGWLSFDYKTYFADAIRGERFARVSITIPTLAAGASGAIQTAPMKNVRVNQNEQIVGSFNVDSKGLRIVAWVSVADTVSYYIENPASNPIGSVTLGTVSILLKTV